MLQWNKTIIEGYPAWTGETDLMALTVIPALGSKVISLRSKVTGREWLWRSGKPLGNAGYGSPFGSGDESGWDEMFPCVNECGYPNHPWQGVRIPDHGEVWALPWTSQCMESALHCCVKGANFPYQLEKTYSFASNNTICISYKLTNESNFPMSFLWAAHPLFKVHEGMKLRVPDNLNEIEVSYSARGRLGEFGEIRPWPSVQTEEGIIELDTISGLDGRSAEKFYFTGKLRSGFAVLHDPATNEAVRFDFPAGQVPYLALWLNNGGYGGHYHAAIEPATGRMDDLQHAVRRGEASVVEANGNFHWAIRLSIT